MCRKNICINQEKQVEAHQKGNNIIFEYVETRLWNLFQGEPRWNLQKEHFILSRYQEKWNLEIENGLNLRLQSPFWLFPSTPPLL